MRLFVALFVVLLTTCSHCNASAASSVIIFPLTKVKRTDALNHDESPAEAARARVAFLKSFPASGSNTVPVTNQVQFYTTSIGVGNPPTFYNLALDTFSSNTVLGFGKPYNRTSTSIPTGQNLYISYELNIITASGLEYLDQVTVAPGLTITNQSIGGVLFSTGFNVSGLDGIIGLGPADLTIGTLTPGQNATIPTVMNNLLSQGLIKKQVLGVYFAPSINDSDTNGLLTYGGVDRSLFEGELMYVPVTATYPSSNYWGINVTSCDYGNFTIIPTSTAGVVDTGTAPILLADDFFTTYMGAIPGATFDSNLGLLVIPPSSIPSMHPLNFKIGHKVFTLDVAAQLIPESQNTAWGGVAGKQYGVVGTFGIPSGRGLDFIFGMALMDMYYTVFDADANRVGFAQTKNTFSA